MEFVITFLEGFISFISPCMLPLLPLYVSYFAGGADKKHKDFGAPAATVPAAGRKKRNTGVSAMNSKRR